MERLLVRVFTEAVRSGSLSVVAASGRHFRFGDGTGKPVAIRFATSAWQTAVLLDPELRLGEAYMEQGLLLEEGSLADLLDLLTRNLSTSHPPSWARWLRGLRSVLRAAFQTKWHSRLGKKCEVPLQYQLSHLQIVPGQRLAVFVRLF